jgi:4-hydroxy-tetrahydrodipicolinate synthase
MNITKFRGSTVAHITPFDSAGNINETQLRTLVDRQINEGTDVLLACGTTGESVTLDHTEKIQVTKIIIDQAAGRVPVLVGAGTNDTRDAIQLTLDADKAGADAILSVTPYYNKPTQEGLYQHFKAIASETDLPVILYNVPGRTSCNIATDTILRLAEIDNIIGVKEASGNMSQSMQILRNRPTDFLVLSGDDSLSLPMIALGGDGTISVVANEVPGLFSSMIHSALDGNWQKAREMHTKLLPLMEINFIETNPIPVKTALAMMGLIEDNFRLPLVKMAEQNRVRLQSVLAELHLL